MDEATLRPSTISMSDGSANVSFTVTFSNGDKTVTIHPNAPLAHSTTYAVTISTGVTDTSGNPMPKAFVWSFTTG